MSLITYLIQSPDGEIHPCPTFHDLDALRRLIAPAIVVGIQTETQGKGRALTGGLRVLRPCNDVPCHVVAWSAEPSEMATLPRSYPCRNTLCDLPLLDDTEEQP